MQNKAAAKPRSLRWALLINALFLAAVLLLFFPYFEGNDDQAMMVLLNGAYDGVPTAFLVFLGMTVSYPLKLLTEALPGVPWYALFQYALVFASFTAASNALIRRGKRGGIALTLLMLCAFGFEGYTRMQFTRAAGIAVACGALALIEALAGRKARVPAAIGGAILIVLGAGCRFRMLLPTLALMLPAALFALVRQWRRGGIARAARLPLWFAAALAVCLALNLVNSAVYRSDEGWSRYIRYNADRSKLLDLSFPDFEENAELYASMDITEADIQMYRGWDFADPDRFSEENVHTLAQARADRTLDAAFWREFGENIPLGYLRYAWIPAFLIAAALAVYASRRNLLWLALGVVTLAAMSGWLVFTGRYLVRRVDFCLFFALTISLLYLFQSTAPPADFPAGRRFALCMVLVAALFAPGFADFARQSAADAAATARNREIGDLIYADDDHVYLTSVLSADFMWNGFSLWQTIPPEYSRNVCMLGGCSSYTPVWYRMNAQRGIENPFAWCIDNDRAYILANSHMTAIMGYIRRHFNPDAEYQLVKQIDGCNVYRVFTGATAPQIDGEVSDAPAPGLRTADIAYAREDRKLVVSGRVWLDGESSYLGEAWVELSGDDGKVRWHRMTQYEIASEDGAAPVGDLQGQFSKYSVSCTLPKRFSGRASIVYRNGDAWYRVPVADLKV